jgi:vacuolar-type H+-ATPase subunit I/STV1
MGFYGGKYANYEIEVLGEAVNVSDAKNKYGISKDGVDKNKIDNAINEEKTAWDKTKLALEVIGIIVLIVPLFIGLPVIIPMLLLIGHLKDKLSANKLDKVIKELEKTVEKLKKKIDKCKDPEEKKKLEEVLKKTEQELESAKKEKDKAEKEKRLQEELDTARFAQNVNKTKKLPEDNFYPDQLGFYMALYNVSDNDMIKLIGTDKESLNFIGLKPDPNDEYVRELYYFLKKEFNLIDEKDKSVNVIFAIDDTLILYGYKTKKFYFGDWEPNNKYMYTFNNLRSVGKKLLTEESYQEALAELGIKYKKII